MSRDGPIPKKGKPMRWKRSEQPKAAVPTPGYAQIPDGPYKVYDQDGRLIMEANAPRSPQYPEDKS